MYSCINLYAKHNVSCVCIYLRLLLILYYYRYNLTSQLNIIGRRKRLQIISDEHILRLLLIRVPAQLFASPKSENEE